MCTYLGIIYDLPIIILQYVRTESGISVQCVYNYRDKYRRGTHTHTGEIIIER